MSTERIHVIASGGGREGTHGITNPETAARLLIEAANPDARAHRTSVDVTDLANDLRHNPDAYEVTDEFQRTFFVAPEGSPHLDLALGTHRS